MILVVVFPSHLSLCFDFIYTLPGIKLVRRFDLIYMYCFYIKQLNQVNDLDLYSTKTTASVLGTVSTYIKTWEKCEVVVVDQWREGDFSRVLIYVDTVF